MDERDTDADPRDAPPSGHGAHQYRATLRWNGSTGSGYDAYDRTHAAVTDPPTVPLQLTADPAFRGDPSLLNPEQLLVLAASSCQLLSFLAVAARARIDVIAYTDDAMGEMPDAPRMAVERITLRPTITVREGPSLDQLAHLVEVAHRECFISSSLRSEIMIEPTFLLAGSAARGESPGPESA